MTCRLCGKEKEKRNQMHGHLMQCHRAEYAAAGYNMDRIISGQAAERVREPKERKEKRLASFLPQPAGFRFLTKRDEAEAKAIAAGYTYIDASENLYTIDDAKAEAWI